MPSLVLMENAGRGAAEALLAAYPSARRFVVVCGAGNNGGDGFVVARRLLVNGRSPSVLVLPDPASLEGDARASFESFAGLGGVYERLGPGTLAALDGALSTADAVVDAVFGTGLTRDIAGFERAVLERLDTALIPRVALDLPSGLDADRGVPLGFALHADLTLTFAHRKRGLETPIGRSFCGRVEVVDIGIPGGLAERLGYGVAALEPADAAAAIPRRGALSHKGSSGRVLVVAGSPGKIGAALLSAHGALRTGAGLVTIAAPPEAAAILDTRVLEAMTARLDPSGPESALALLLEHADAAVVGPGVGMSEAARRAVAYVVSSWTGRVVVDADALTHFAGRAGDLAAAAGRLVLTPHPGELARLLGMTTADIEGDRFSALAKAVEITQATVLLKGSPTLVGAPGVRVAVSEPGHPILATGGSGDVLSGAIGALLVAADPYRAACAGAFVHGRAAERLAGARGVDRGALAHEVADELPGAIAGLSPAGRFVSG